MTLSLYDCLNKHADCVLCLNTSPAYGATLIEHSLIEAGLPGSVKVDSEADAAQGLFD